MQRSINMLYPLELFDEHADKLSGDNIKSQDAGHSKNGSVKPLTRYAAITMRHKINKLLENNALSALFTFY